MGLIFFLEKAFDWRLAVQASIISIERCSHLVNALMNSQHRVIMG